MINFAIRDEILVSGIRREVQKLQEMQVSARVLLRLLVPEMSKNNCIRSREIGHRSLLYGVGRGAIRELE